MMARCFGTLSVTAMLILALSVSPVTAQELPRFTPPTPPPVSAKAVFVYDADAGVPLFARDPDRPLAPASLTKIATALVVIEHTALDETVTIRPEDMVDESQSRAHLVAGDELTVRDLLVALVVPSGNDAALALARHVGSKLPNGSADPVGRFVAEMNALVADRGLANTRFANPSGIDAPEHYASARDLAMLMAEATADPVLAEAMGTASATLPSAIQPEGYPLNTTHDLVLEGVAVAGKTGTTTEAGGCLATVTEESGNRIVTVVLGSDWYFDEFNSPKSIARYDDTRTLLAALVEQYAWIAPATPEAVPGLPQELAIWGATLAGATSVPVPRERLPDLGYRLVLEPPAEPGSPVGAVLFVLGSELLAEQPLVQSGVAVQDLGARATSPPDLLTA